MQTIEQIEVGMGSGVFPVLQWCPPGITYQIGVPALLFLNGARVDSGQCCYYIMSLCSRIIEKRSDQMNLISFFVLPVILSICDNTRKGVSRRLLRIFVVYLLHHCFLDKRYSAGSGFLFLSQNYFFDARSEYIIYLHIASFFCINYTTFMCYLNGFHGTLWLELLSCVIWMAFMGLTSNGIEWPRTGLRLTDWMGLTSNGIEWDCDLFFLYFYILFFIGASLRRATGEKYVLCLARIGGAWLRRARVKYVLCLAGWVFWVGPYLELIRSFPLRSFLHSHIPFHSYSLQLQGVLRSPDKIDSISTVRSSISL